MGGAALALGLISIVVVNIQGTEYRSICKEVSNLIPLTLSCMGEYWIRYDKTIDRLNQI